MIPPRVRTSTAKAPSTPVVPKAPLQTARAPPPKRSTGAVAQEVAADPELAANTSAEPTAWRNRAPQASPPVPRVSLRAASALPRAASPNIPKARPAPRARSSSPTLKERGDDVGFGNSTLDPEIAGAELEEVPPPQPEGLVRSPQGAAPGASDADQAAQAKAKALGAQQPVTPPKGPPAKRPPSDLGPPLPLPSGAGVPADQSLPYKAPPNVVKYKGPPHGAFVRGIRSRSSQIARPHRSKPKPLSLVHPQHRARNSYHS